MRPNVDGQVVVCRGRPMCLPSCAPDGLTAFRVAAGGHLGPPLQRHAWAVWKDGVAHLGASVFIRVLFRHRITRI